MTEQDPLKKVLYEAQAYIVACPPGSTWHDHRKSAIVEIQDALDDPLTVSFRWIPVEEGLPDGEGFYECVINEGEPIIDGSMWFDSAKGFPHPKVTHWASIPMPSSAGGEG